jgi:thymidylate kinase
MLLNILTSAEMRTRMQRTTGPSVVSVSGIDGSGKTRLIASLVEILGTRGISAESARFDLPAVIQGNSLPDYLYSLHADKNEAVEESIIGDCIAFEYMRFHMTSVFSAPAATELLVLDRFLWDYLLTNELVFDSLTDTQIALMRSLPLPQVRIFLDCDPDTALGRIKHRMEPKSVLERRDILIAKRERYRMLSREFDGTLIDGAQTESAVLEQALNSITQSLARYGSHR